MTDLGKTALRRAVPGRESSARLPSLTSRLLSFSDEQEDESMETAGKVEPV